MWFSLTISPSKCFVCKTPRNQFLYEVGLIILGASSMNKYAEKKGNRFVIFLTTSGHASQKRASLQSETPNENLLQLCSRLFLFFMYGCSKLDVNVKLMLWSVLWCIFVLGLCIFSLPLSKWLHFTLIANDSIFKGTHASKNGTLTVHKILSCPWRKYLRKQRITMLYKPLHWCRKFECLAKFIPPAIVRPEICKMVHIWWIVVQILAAISTLNQVNIPKCLFQGTCTGTNFCCHLWYTKTYHSQAARKPLSICS